MRSPSEDFSDTPDADPVFGLDRIEGYRRLMGNRYFSRLENGDMTREEFRDSQKQFFFAVRYFSRPMAALMARMPDSGKRRGLIHNLAEEHGFEDEDGPAAFDPALAHDLTMLAFLATLDVPRAAMEREPEGASVRAFNLGLMGACLMEPPEFAFACLGAIEFSFAEISAIIGRRVVELGWISQENLVHYKLHAEIDKRHAADFLAPQADAWRGGGEGRRTVAEGLAYGLHIFDALYDNLNRDATTAAASSS